MCILPVRDALGRPIVFFRFRNVIPEGKCLLQDIITAAALLTESLTEIEEFQIRGIVYIFDVSGLSSAYVKITSVEDILKITRNAERTVAARHKGFHIVNVPAALSYFVNLAIKSSPVKIRERVKFYSSFDQLNIVDKKHLPQEYGGTIPMKEMSSKSKNRI